MDAEFWRQVETLFNRIADLPCADRDPILALVSPEVRAAVEAMLEMDSQAAQVLEASVAEAGRAAVAARPRHFGAWRVTGILGEGGMGVVYRAVRDDNAFQKEVAIKVLHLGATNSTSRLRFVQERRILALLEHPNIARLIDGGEDDQGTAFIVMELVQGTNILDYANRLKLDTEARLRLFCAVCSGVLYAHRNLVVHRDLKPANILVDEAGTPKLLDFGVARLVDTDSPKTLTGFQTLTPQYASPEQVRGEVVTTASDVYSLGVVLYELLTGRRPYEFATLSPAEIDRIVCRTAPAPSQLPLDLDTILAMALRKEPARRYQSVDQLAADCVNFLERRPVSARPDTLPYRARKFIRRNWLPVGAAAVAILALAAGIAVALRQAAIARARFEDVRQLAHAFIFDFQDEAARVNGNTRLREQMVKTALQYLDRLARSAGDDRELLAELATGYERIGEVQGQPSAPNLGHPAEALVSLSRAAVFHERAAALDPKYGWKLGRFYQAYATLLRQTGDPRAAAAVLAVGRRHVSDALRATPNSLPLQTDDANMWCMTGDIEEDQSHMPAAWKANKRCRDRALQLLSASRSTPVLATVVHGIERFGTSSTGIGSFGDARAAFDEEERYALELLAREPANPRYQRNLVVLAQFRSSLYCSADSPSLDQIEPCLRYAKEYLERARRMAEGDPNNQSSRTSVAIALSRVSWVDQFVDPADSVRLGRESVRLFDELAAGNKGTFLASRRARALGRLAESLLVRQKRTGRGARHQTAQEQAFQPRAAAKRAGVPQEATEALAAASESLGVQRTVVARNPSDPAENIFLSRVLDVTARALIATGDSVKAHGPRCAAPNGSGTGFPAACRSQTCACSSPEIAHVQPRRATVSGYCDPCTARLVRSEAEQYLVEAESIASVAATRNPGDLPTVKQLSDARLALAGWFSGRHDPGTTREWYRRALAAWQGFPDQNAYVSRKASEVESLLSGDLPNSPSLNSN